MSESDAVGFKTYCPNGHLVEPKFNRQELQEILESGVLMLYCVTCDERWVLGEIERQNLQKFISEQT